MGWNQLALIVFVIICWQLVSADIVGYYAQLSYENVKNDTMHLKKYQHLILKGTDHVDHDCMLGEFASFNDVCSGGSQQCGDGMCRCCIDKENRSFADCSQPLQNVDNGLVNIRSLPPGIQVLNFSFNYLDSDNITEDFFDTVTDLTHLYLSSNFLHNLDRDMFKKLTKLKCLNLNWNIFLRSDEDALCEMLQIPGLEELSAAQYFFPPDNARYAYCSNLSGSTVKRLNLMDTPTKDFYVLDLTWLSNVPGLKHVVFIQSVFRLVYTSQPLQITVLALDFNVIVLFFKTCSKDGKSLFPLLKVLSLSFNRLTDLSAFVQTICLPMLTGLDISNNVIQRVSSRMFDAEHFPRLENLDISKQRPGLSLFRLGSKCFGNPSLRTLNLESNDILFGYHDVVSEDIFTNCTGLENLWLDKNNFRSVDDKRFLALFGHLHGLKNLSIAFSQLEIVPLKTLQKFTKLVYLDLQGNLISSVPDKAFQPLENLQYLDLSNNKLTVVREQSFGESLLRSNTSFLALSRNPLDCTCELMWFRDLYIKNPRHFTNIVLQRTYRWKYLVNSSKYFICHNLDGLMLKDFRLNSQACLLMKETCIHIIFFCSFFTLFLTAFTLLFWFRWHLRLLLHEAFRGRADLRRIRLQRNNFDYDVFVSYAAEDLLFVRQHLVPQLERVLGLRLCIHERDFIPGNNIVDNITDCVESSKKVLMIFSKHFVRSQWCQFELSYCLSHVMEYDDALIVVCVDDVVSREMTSAMMAVLKTTTYIQWEEYPNAVRSFWGRLRIALQEITHHGQHAV